VYARTVGERELNFQVSGLLWQRSLVMRDLETETLWSHLLGRGMRGELEGVELETIPASMTTWGEWVKRYPDTTVLAMSRTVRRYDEDAWGTPGRFVFGLLLGFDAPAPAVGLERLGKDGVIMVESGDRRFVVTHVSEGGSVQAFELENETGDLDFAGVDERIMKDEQTGSAWNRHTGKALSGPRKGTELREVPGTISFRTAWEAFHPDDEIVE
jgi:hypothetical protein